LQKWRINGTQRANVCLMIKPITGTAPQSTMHSSMSDKESSKYFDIHILNDTKDEDNQCR
jgi:hypothetical protein